MKTSRYARAFLAALITLAVTGSVSIAHADIKDYEFQLIDQTVKKGDAIISVRLVHKPDGKPVPDADGDQDHADAEHRARRLSV
jgi:hypothetical protein